MVNAGKGIEGYKLKTNSPAIKAGAVIKNNGGHDYYGNRISDDIKQNIGVFNKQWW